MRSLRVVADGRVAVAGGDADHRDVVVAELVEVGADEVQVLPEAAGPLAEGMRKATLSRLVLDDAQEVAEDDLLRVALVAGGHAAAEVERALVGVGRGQASKPIERMAAASR